jgi:ribosome biogenesis GTPase
MVLGIDKGRYRVLLHTDDRMVNASLAKELRKAGPAVGDIVALAGDTSETVGALARIVRIEPRSSLLRRSADDSDQVERVIVANAQQMMIVVAITNPEPRTRFAGLDVPVILNRSDAPSLSALQTVLAGKTTVVVGHSGVGKSTLVNALVPDAARATGGVNAVTGRGRHTSTSVRAIALQDGWIIDTPGVRSFGLGHIKPENLLRSFQDLYAVIENCPRDCSHLAGSPDCALDEAIAAGTLGQHGAARVDSLRRLMASLESKQD